ncbi:MAG TPA: tetratricopeptide repeat protein [Stellaceae bacterium]|nr:tetratricopeptide repeat protein [Stellaceae bacterium]
MTILRDGIFGLGLAACLVLSQQAHANDSPSYNPPEAAAADSSDMVKARAAIAAKNWSGAIAILYPLSKSSPQDADVENLLGFSYRMLGQYPQAFVYYDRALAIDPAHKGALEYEGEAYVETNQLPKAERNLATLKRACGASGCAEIAQLESAIGRHKKQAKIN